MLAAGGVYLLLETLWVRVTRYALPQARGVRAVQISDLHGCTHFLNGRISDQVNALAPDGVLVTGDLASDHADLGRVLTELARIRCPNVLFVPGNYEREDAAAGRTNKRQLSEQEYQALLGRIGQQMTVLVNAGLILTIKGRTLHVYGFDNARYGDERAPSQPWPQADGVILLSHSPNIIKLVSGQQLKFDALLVGHTHGGQVRLFGQAFDEYRHFKAGRNPTTRGLFYVNRGLGTSRLPFRLGVPPEILVLEG